MPEGKNLAQLIGEWLQALPSRFTAFGRDFAFEVGQTREGFGGGVRLHETTRLS